MEAFSSASEYLGNRFAEIAAENEVMRRGLERSGVTVVQLADEGAKLASNFDQLRVELLNGAIAAGATSEEIDELKKQLGEARYETLQAAEVQGQLTEVTGDATEATDEARAALEEYADAQAELRDEILKSLGGLFDYEKALIDLEDTYASFQRQQQEATLVQQDATRSTAEKDEATRKLREAELAVADGALQAAAAYAREQGAMDGSLRSAQLQVEKLVELGAKYPELREEIGAYIGKLGEIPAAVPTEIQALIDSGDYDQAERLLNLLARKRSVVYTATYGGGYDPRGGIDGNPATPYAMGGLITRPTFAQMGEGGLPEAVLPLTKPSRLAELLGDPRIGGPVAAAMGAGGSSSSGGFSMGSTITLVVEGEPITARIVAHERAQVAELRAGARQ
jgi:hypothetical protein